MRIKHRSSIITEREKLHILSCLTGEQLNKIKSFSSDSSKDYWMREFITIKMVR